MTHLIDRRQWGKKRSTVNRQRFIRRFKDQIKRALAEQIGRRGVTDTQNGESVSIPARDTGEPTFRQGAGGHRERIFPGNHEYVGGDRIPRPQGGGGGQGQGRRAGDSGEGEDEVHFEISRDEYLDLMFEDLELPRLDITQLKNVERFRNVRAGYRTDGVPANLSIVRSLERALARRIALSGGDRRELRELEAELEQPGDDAQEERVALRARIEELRERIARVPFIDTFDLRFTAFAKQPMPSTQAVMFCLMDVSGSMDQQRKDIAKRFFLLLYLFLGKSYANVQVVFIRHHTQAKEVSEQEFFHSQESAQASDGDNWHDDSPICQDLLANRILPCVRYFSYIEIAEQPQGLWHHYQALLATHPNLATRRILQAEDIYPVFRELFRKQHA